MVLDWVENRNLISETGSVHLLVLRLLQLFRALYFRHVLRTILGHWHRIKLKILEVYWLAGLPHDQEEESAFPESALLLLLKPVALIMLIISEVRDIILVG